MVDPNTRSVKRTPVTLKIKFKSETLEQFIERYAVDVSQGGIFIRTKEPLAVGTQMKFEFQLRDASPLIAGEGTVVWTRENDPSRPAIAPGMGVRFDRLADGSQNVLERILADKAKQQPQRPAHETTKPPLFTDTPTRVAPAPVADALLGNSDRTRVTGAPPMGQPTQRKRADSERTPLPSPMPFHSDADEFDEKAFEEATKVRSLEELAAQTAGKPPMVEMATSIIPPDELAMRRQQARLDATVSDPPREEAEDAHAAKTRPAPKVMAEDLRDSAPNLPDPPEQPPVKTVVAPAPAPPPAPAPRLLDTSPSPRMESALGAPPAELKGTKLGVEPAKVPGSPTTSPGVTPAKVEPRMSTQAKEAAASTTPAFVSGSKDLGRSRKASPTEQSAPSMPSTSGPSIAPIVIGILVAVAAVVAGVWFFVLREPVEEATGKKTNVVENSGSGSGSAAKVVDSGSGSAGSGSATKVVDNGSGSAGSGSATPPPPKADAVETIVSVGKDVTGATIEIDGTDQNGPAPLKAKLEKGKVYKAHVKAAGYATLDVDITGGNPPAEVKLVAKPRLLTVTSDPPGAQILIDGNATNKVTPADLDLKALNVKAGAKIKVSLRRGGYKPFDTTVDLATATESPEKVVAVMPGAQLALAPRPPPPPPPPPHPPTGSGDNPGSGSGGPVTSPDPPTNGSAETPPTPPPPPPPPPVEPEPTFVNPPSP